MNQPHVSIGLPVYNGENYLVEALDSILNQTFTDFELIISDNASTDSTQKICQEYAAKDKRIRYYRHEQNSGAARNYNCLVELARGKYFKWAAHDDLCAPKYLEECVKVLDSDSSIVLCHSKTTLIDDKGQRLIFDATKNYFINRDGRSFRKPESPANLNCEQPHKRYQGVLLEIRWCFQVFGLIRTENLRQTTLIKYHNGGDKVLLSELSLMGHLAEVPETLFFRRCHAQQFSSGLGTAKERDIWFRMNPKATQGLVSPRLLCLGGYFRAIWESKLDCYERILCLNILIRWAVKFDSWGRFFSEMYRENFRVEINN